MDRYPPSYYDQLLDLVGKLKDDVNEAVRDQNCFLRHFSQSSLPQHPHDSAALALSHLNLIVSSNRTMLAVKRIATNIEDLISEMQLHQTRNDAESPAAPETDFLCHSPLPASFGRGAPPNSFTDYDSPCPFLRNPNSDPFCGSPPWTEIDNFTLQ